MGSSSEFMDISNSTNQIKRWLLYFVAKKWCTCANYELIWIHKIFHNINLRGGYLFPYSIYCNVSWGYIKMTKMWFQNGIFKFCQIMNPKCSNVTTLTSSSRLNVECKRTWSQKNVFRSETHSHKWGKV
jgi:hypothetical protein